MSRMCSRVSCQKARLRQYSLSHDNAFHQLTDSRTGARIEQILREYLARLERSVLPNPLSPTGELPPALLSKEQVKAMNLIVITDGGES